MLSQGKKIELEESLENVLMPLLGKQVFFFSLLSIKPLHKEMEFFCCFFFPTWSNFFSKLPIMLRLR